MAEPRQREDPDRRADADEPDDPQLLAQLSYIVDEDG